MSHIRISLIIILMAVFSSFLPAIALSDDLPWGKTQSPKLITPGQQGNQDSETTERKNPLPSGQDNYRRRSNSSDAYNRTYNRRNSDVYRDRRYEPRRRYRTRQYSYDYEEETYSDNEILDAGHRFFGRVTKGLARVIAYAFSEAGRPNGFILGEEAGGAIVAGLRYGEGVMITKSFGRHRVYWQGPSVGYDFGAEGSKTMILVYDLRHPSEIYQRFAGINGSAYLVGGVGITFQKKGHVVLARIQSGVGLRLGANIGYLKYTRRPTWNPF